MFLKSSQKSSNGSQMSHDSNYVSASSSYSISANKEDDSSTDSASLNEKLAFKGANSPLIVQKPFRLSNSTTEVTARKDISNFFDNFAKKTTTQKLKQTSYAGENTDPKTKDPINNKRDDEVLESQNNSTNIFPNTTKNDSTVNNIKKIDNKKILKDVETLNGNKSLVKSKKAISNNNSNTNAKQISEYFIKFEYKKTNENKFIIN